MFVLMLPEHLVFSKIEVFARIKFYLPKDLFYNLAANFLGHGQQPHAEVS